MKYLHLSLFILFSFASWAAFHTYKDTELVRFAGTAFYAICAHITFGKFGRACLRRHLELHPDK